jgi:hypothetical protein
MRAISAFPVYACPSHRERRAGFTIIENKFERCFKHQDKSTINRNRPIILAHAQIVNQANIAAIWIFVGE